MCAIIVQYMIELRFRIFMNTIEQIVNDVWNSMCHYCAWLNYMYHYCAWFNCMCHYCAWLNYMCHYCAWLNNMCLIYCGQLYYTCHTVHDLTSYAIARIIDCFPRVGHPFFSKECNVLAFFSVLYKRTWRSLRSFPFFIKEHGVLCILFRSL